MVHLHACVSVTGTQGLEGSSLHLPGPPGCFKKTETSLFHHNVRHKVKPDYEQITEKCGTVRSNREPTGQGTTT